MSEPCDHKVTHKQVLGHTLCVCCSHCQEENSRLKEVLEKIASIPVPGTTSNVSIFSSDIAREALAACKGKK